MSGNYALFFSTGWSATASTYVGAATEVVGLLGVALGTSAEVVKRIFLLRGAVSLTASIGMGTRATAVKCDHLSMLTLVRERHASPCLAVVTSPLTLTSLCAHGLLTFDTSGVCH